METEAPESHRHVTLVEPTLISVMGLTGSFCAEFLVQLATTKLQRLHTNWGIREELVLIPLTRFPDMALPAIQVQGTHPRLGPGLPC